LTEQGAQYASSSTLYTTCNRDGTGSKPATWPDPEAFDLVTQPDPDSSLDDAKARNIVNRDATSLHKDNQHASK